MKNGVITLQPTLENYSTRGVSLFDLISDISTLDILINNDMNERIPNHITMPLTDKDRLGEPIYSMIGYPSKIYYQNISQFIEAYSKKDDLVLDSMCGTGSTAIASLMKGRKCIISDGSVGASFIAKWYTMPLNIPLFIHEFGRLESEVKGKINSLYKLQCECNEENKKCTNYGILTSRN